MDNLARIGDRIQEKMAATGVKLLWGTANLFSHPRYMAGAASNPDPDVFRFAATQVRHCIELTKRLGGENYVLWGGREGYDIAAEYRPQAGEGATRPLPQDGGGAQAQDRLQGTILIEPKPHEPTKHQYDLDVETVYGFLLAQRAGEGSEAEYRGQPRHAGRPQL